MNRFKNTAMQDNKEILQRLSCLKNKAIIKEQGISQGLNSLKNAILQKKNKGYDNDRIVSKTIPNNQGIG